MKVMNLWQSVRSDLWEELYVKNEIRKVWILCVCGFNVLWFESGV